MKFLLILTILITSVNSIAETHLPHLPQSFRYAKEVNPIDFLKLDPRIIEMIGGVAMFCKKHKITFMITSAIRTPESNAKANAKSKTHVEARALDFSIKSYWGWTPELIAKLEVYIERRYGEYGFYTPGKKQKVILIHKVVGGTLHAHLQVTSQNFDTYTDIMDKLTDDMLYVGK